MSKRDTKALEIISKSSQQFRLKLYNILRKTPGNVVVSSTSLEVLLVLAAMGGKGNTSGEIKSALKLPEDKQLVKNGYNIFMTSLQSTGDTILNVATKIFNDTNFPLRKDFQQEAKSLLVSAENIEFSENPKASLLAINSWVEGKTNAKIKNLFSEGDVTSDTIMVMINAVYFKGKWKIPFDPSLITKEPFHISESETKEVDMMHINNNFGYSELGELNAKILVMPYLDDKMCMMILLPNKVDGLKDMENKLHSIQIADLMQNSRVTKVKVALPRFTVEKCMDFESALNELGINSMFDASLADFSGINETKGAYVNKIVQKAFIEINEEGCEAAAASGAGMMMRSMPVYEEFTADKPFLFLLLELHNSIVLFQGCYVGEVKNCKAQRELKVAIF